jgi:hypothetical protein
MSSRFRDDLDHGRAAYRGDSEEASRRHQNLGGAFSRKPATIRETLLLEYVPDLDELEQVTIRPVHDAVEVLAFISPPDMGAMR